VSDNTAGAASEARALALRPLAGARDVAGESLSPLCKIGSGTPMCAVLFLLPLLLLPVDAHTARRPVAVSGLTRGKVAGGCAARAAVVVGGHGGGGVCVLWRSNCVVGVACGCVLRRAGWQ
jgi:hypothetical protein